VVYKEFVKKVHRLQSVLLYRAERLCPKKFDDVPKDFYGANFLGKAGQSQHRLMLVLPAVAIPSLRQINVGDGKVIDC